MRGVLVTTTKLKSNNDKKIKSTIKKLFQDQETNINKAANSLKVLAHPSRLKILCVLCYNEFSVQKLEEFTEIPQATLSQHLALLKSRNVVESRKDGNFSIYRLSNDSVRDLFEMIKETYCESA